MIAAQVPQANETAPSSGESLEVRRFHNLVVVKSVRGLTALHTQNLEVATLHAEAERLFAAPLWENEDSELLSELKAWSASTSVEARDSQTSSAIRSITINVAQVCNLGCTYCAAGGDGTYGERVKSIDLSTTERQIRFLMERVPSGETFRITFLGGEPLVAPQVVRSLVRFARLEAAGRGILLRFDMVTNGTLITPEIAELLADMNCHLTISIDGPPELNDRSRPTKTGLGSTAMTLKGIEHLRPLLPRLGRLTLAAVFGRHNTDVVATWQFLRRLPADSIKFDFAPEANDQTASRLYTDALLQVSEMAFALGGERELRRLSIFDAYFKILDSQTRILNHCGAGKDHLQIDGKGRLSACQWFVGQPDEHLGQGVSLDDEKRTRLFGDALIERNNCQSCWARFVCGGGCMFVHKTKTGSKNKVDHDFCERQRRSIAKGIELYGRSRSTEGSAQGG